MLKVLGWSALAGLLVAIGIVIGLAMPATTPGLSLPQLPRQLEVRTTALTTYEAADVNLNTRAAKAAEEALIWTKVGAVGGAVGTVLLVITLVFTAQATKASTENAMVAAAAVELERDNADRTLRPYLFAYDFNWLRMTKGAANEEVDGFRLSVMWKNFGTTPGEDVTDQISFRVADRELPDDFDYPDLTPNNYLGSCAPGATFAVSTFIPIADLRTAQSEGRRLHLWGWSEYESRPGKPRHRTEFHWAFDIYGDLEATDWTQIRFVASNGRRFNGADRYCMRQPHRNLTRA